MQLRPCRWPYSQTLHHCSTKNRTRQCQELQAQKARKPLPNALEPSTTVTPREHRSKRQNGRCHPSRHLQAEAPVPKAVKSPQTPPFSRLFPQEMRSLTKTSRATTLKLGKTEEPPFSSRNFERTVYLSTYLSIIIYLSVYLSEYLNIYINISMSISISLSASLSVSI